MCVKRDFRRESCDVGGINDYIKIYVGFFVKNSKTPDKIDSDLVK
jgi:hypothetical protein